MRTFTSGFWNGERIPRELLENGEKKESRNKNNNTQENEQKNNKKSENVQKKYKTQNQKKRHRERGKQHAKENDFTILLSNLRGFRSKKHSLEKAVKKVKPSMILLNETQMLGKAKVYLKSYTSWSRNRSVKGGGGVATSVARQYMDSTVGAGEGVGEDEYLVTRIECFSPALTVVNCYGEQRKFNKVEVEARWSRLRNDLENIRARKDFCVLGGDLNKLVGCDELGVPGNNPLTSPGGKLLRTLLATGAWILVNGLGEEVVEGGPFTRKDPATGKELCLDLFIVSRELRPFVSKLFVDSARSMKIARVLRNKNKVQLVYPDHYPVLLTLTGLPRVKEHKQEKVVRWNLAKEGGWSRYKELTMECKNILKVIENKDLSIEETKQIFDKKLDKIKFQAFGKVTIENKAGKSLKEKENKETSEEEIAKKLLEEQTAIAEHELNEIDKAKIGKVGKVWEIKKRIMGGKKGAMEATAIINPTTNKLAVSRNEIKQATLQYCVDTLANNEPANIYFEKHIKEKKKKVEDFLNLKDGDFKATEDTFYRNLAKFKSSRKRNYDFLVKAGEGFHNAVFRFCQKMFDEEKFPVEFFNTTLHMIFKPGKGTRREILSDNRFIHSKFYFVRAAEGLIVEDGLKEALIEGSSIYQIGGQPGHRSEELVFVLKSIIAKYKFLQEILVIQLYDLSKYFDKEMIQDAILTCIKRKADPKAIRLWYKLNEHTQIQVKTGAGMSEFAKVGAVLGQGTLGGAIISQAVLDDAVMEHFSPGEAGQPSYGEVLLAPCMFQDDLENSSISLESARKANRKINFLLNQRALRLNKEKSVCLIMASKKRKQEYSEELKISPLMCGEVEIKEKQVFKWLGQYLSTRGLADSVEETIIAREGKIRGACLEIAQIINDWRSVAVGGMESALLLWEACCLPSLLHGAGTWMEISGKSEQRLNALQRWFVRLVYQVGPGAPIASLTWDVALLDMRLQVWREKVMLVLHFRSMEMGALASSIYSEQEAMAWPSLFSETKKICEELNIEDCNKTHMNRKDYRKLVTNACHVLNEIWLRRQGEGKEKCGRIVTETYGKKSYVSNKRIHEVRNTFRTRFGLLPFAGNYGHDKRFAKTNYLCRCAQNKETETHLTSGSCITYQDIREKYENLDNDKDLIQFFSEVLERREELDKEQDDH